VLKFAVSKSMLASTPAVKSVSRAGTTRFYRPELDCLRFFAFFGVFVFHTFDRDPGYYAARHVPFGTLIASAVSAGRFGVDLFFLLSAYLITELLLREQDQRGKLDLRSFYARRILRIWPLYFLCILIAVLLPLLDHDQYFPLPYAIAFVALSGNWIDFLGYPVHSVMWALWSVSFEEQFYLVWPTFISKARSSKGLLIACGTLLTVATLSRQLFLDHALAVGSESAIFTFSLTRLDPLALGIASAVILRKWTPPSGWVSRLSFLGVGLSLWLLAGHFFKLSRIFMLFGYPAMALGAWAIFIAALRFPWTPQWLRYLGKISYGLYVFHGLINYYVSKLFRGGIHDLRSFTIYWFAALALTIAISTLSYQFFESPFLKLKERFAYVKSRPV
jgi:peptidoglycan/LPS O-acetylase OafA/YrhL